jgi:hypothetical protein
MKPEYNFEKSERGKFHHPGATLQIPVYLEPEVLAFLMTIAEKKGVPVDEIANDLLKRGIAIIESAK